MQKLTGRIALLGLVGCTPVLGRGDDLVEPVVMVGITNVSSSERARVADFFASELPDGWRLQEARIVEASAPRTGDALLGEWTVSLPRWEDLEALHKALSSLQDEETEHRILASIQTDAILYYTSSQARANSMASVTIRVSPTKAALYFDTPLPAELGLEAGQPVPTVDGAFSFKPPFSYIRNHAFLYFHSLYENQYRYYAYDMERESQETLQGIHSPAQFEAYLEKL